jgi:FAD synthase
MHPKNSYIIVVGDKSVKESLKQFGYVYDYDLDLNPVVANEKIDIQSAGKVDDKIYGGMMNIGIRPTVEGTTRMIEVNIFDFDEEIYGHTLTVTIKKKLRNEQKFTGLDELKEQLGKDKTSAIEILSF